MSTLGTQLRCHAEHASPLLATLFCTCCMHTCTSRVEGGLLFSKQQHRQTWQNNFFACFSRSSTDSYQYHCIASPETLRGILGNQFSYVAHTVPSCKHRMHGCGARVSVGRTQDILYCLSSAASAVRCSRLIRCAMRLCFCGASYVASGGITW